MTDRTKFSRRTALAGAAALPLAALATQGARAAAPISGPAMSPFHRVTVGGFDVTTLLAGSRAVEDPHTIFGLNVEDDVFAEVSAEANVPTDKTQFFFTPTIVNTGSDLVLFDTGLSAEGTTAALEAAGYSADQVDVVVITHMHGDHVGGMTREDGSLTYANARYVTGTKEFDSWAQADNETFMAKVAPFAEQFSFLEDGGEVASGLTAMAAFGHTPGHMAYMVEDGGTQLVLGADFANHYVWSLAQPDWEVKFDMDKAAAAATRRRMLDMISADKTAFVGYHMPWPGIGYVEKRGDNFVYAPHSYQLML